MAPNVPGQLRNCHRLLPLGFSGLLHAGFEVVLVKHRLSLACEARKGCLRVPVVLVPKIGQPLIHSAHGSAEKVESFELLLRHHLIVVDICKVEGLLPAARRAIVTGPLVPDCLPCVEEDSAWTGLLLFVRKTLDVPSAERLPGVLRRVVCLHDPGRELEGRSLSLGRLILGTSSGHGAAETSSNATPGVAHIGDCPDSLKVAHPQGQIHGGRQYPIEAQPLGLAISTEGDIHALIHASGMVPVDDAPIPPDEPDPRPFVPDVNIEVGV
mmetsp:Transcript_44465/g.96716  ORF Transcript_44465/g.96716 Transcript_44465/m.96716 type:complete len:269 (-) Transcript_44465:1509-2315(-)